MSPPAQAFTAAMRPVWLSEPLPAQQLLGGPESCGWDSSPQQLGLAGAAGAAAEELRQAPCCCFRDHAISIRTRTALRA